jgi:hypothetical protein
MYDSIQTTVCSAQKAVHLTDAQQPVRLNGKGAESTDKHKLSPHTHRMNPLELRTLQEGKDMTSRTNECRAAERSNNWTSARGHTASRETKMQ